MAGRDGFAHSDTTPLHRGKRTMVWQTRITSGDDVSIRHAAEIKNRPRPS